MPELLAPAGDLERLKVALHYGADAVYIGGPLLGLRANAINFSFEDIKEACDYAHNLGKKVYVTVNIVLHNKELKAVVDYLKRLEECNVDAIIVSDLTIVKIALENTKIPVHISTQASSMNVETAKFYKELGCERVVLARECSKEEIEAIKDNAGAQFINIEAGSSNFTDILGLTTSGRLNTEAQKLGDNAKFSINGTTFTTNKNKDISPRVLMLKGAFYSKRYEPPMIKLLLFEDNLHRLDILLPEYILLYHVL